MSDDVPDEAITAGTNVGDHFTIGEDGGWQELVTAIIEAAAQAAAAERERWRAVADQMAEAIRLTREYLGEDVLPAIPGWSWFDALEVYRSAAQEDTAAAGGES